MKNKIKIASVLLTRKCNLRCDYCAIVKSPKTPLYPSMVYFHNNELKADEWNHIFNKLKQNNPDVFLLLYGGEPFVYPHFKQILKYCNDNDIAYTIISNNTDEIQLKIKDAYEYAGVFNGFTSSVDPQIVNLVKNNNSVRNDIDKKTLNGFNRLNNILQNGWAKEVVAEITVMKNNVHNLYNCVKFLSEQGIWSDITFVDPCKSPFYDFSNVKNPDYLVDKTNNVLIEEIQKINIDKNNLLIHIPEMLDQIVDILPSEMYCNINEDIHNCTIDTDGSFRLCLRVRGTDTPDNFKVDDVIDYNGNITEKYKDSIKSDYNKYCKGCNWTCMLMTKNFTENDIQHGQ